MNDCANKKTNLSECNCSYELCPRKGVCCECLVYHRQNNELPACFFSEQAEKTYNRSVRHFVGIHSSPRLTSK